MIPDLRNCSASLDDHGDRVGDVDDLRLGLTDADGLDHDHVERRRQRVGRRARGPGQAAKALAGGGRADEHPAVGRVELDPRAIAQERAAGAARARIDSQHRDRQALAPPGVQQSREQRRLARARGPGDPNHVSRRLAPERLGRDLAQQRRGLLAVGGRGALQQVQRRRRRAQVPLAQSRAEHRPVVVHAT
jgi:hypothetical protein